jgi:hypothetical protein
MSKHDFPRTLSRGRGEVKLYNAAVDTHGDDTLIIRGVVDPMTFGFLWEDDYQREVLRSDSTSTKGSLIRVIDEGKQFPDVELGMRGKSARFHGNTVTLKDPVFIVDGLQRIQAFRTYMDSFADKPLRVNIGATLHLQTDYDWERKRFNDLNGSGRVKVAPSVILRNERHENAGIATLYGLSTNDSGFALYDRVAWGQRQKKGELISGLALLRVAVTLHKRFRSLSVDKKLGGHGGSARDIGFRVENAVAGVGLQHFRSNVKEFFEVIDQVWGVRSVYTAKENPHLKANWLSVVALMFARHANFWAAKEKNKLFIDVNMKRKLRTFRITEPHMSGMIRAGGSTMIPLIYASLIAHMNSGKRVHKLKPYLDDDE